MPVTHVKSDAELRTLLSASNNNSGDILFLVDYSASWCGPCRSIAPVYAQLSEKHGHANFRFLHVDVDECGEVAQEQRIRAMPTFVFYNNTLSSELARLQGADAQGLEAKITELGPKFKAHFVGEGQRLGGGGGSSVTVNANTTLSTDEMFSIAQSSVSYGDGFCRIGLRFLPQVTGPLGGSSKPILRINPGDAVSRIRCFVDSLLELGGVTRPYELHRSHPPGKLDEEATISDSGAAGSVVVVKFV